MADQPTNTAGTKPQRKGTKSGVTTELSVFLKVIPGRAEVIRQALQAAEHDPRRLAAFENIGTLTEARIVLFDNDTRLGFFTVYEGDWDFYIESFLPEVVPAMDRVFRGNVEDYPTKPLAEISVSESKAFLNDHQVTAASFIWLHGDATLKDIRKAQRVQRAFEQVLDSPEGQKALMNSALKPLLAEAAD
jgi:hypothetical protein